MLPLSRAHLQSSFRLVTFLFVLGVVVTSGAAAYFGLARSRVVIIPKQSAHSVRLQLIIGPANHQPDLIGQVTREKKSATVSAPASTTGETVPAHARGTVEIVNKTDQDETFISGLRLQSDSGILVRTTSRIIAPAHSSTTVEAVADPVGPSGELTSGRLMIAALPESKNVLFANVIKPFTGGLAAKHGTLSTEGLTKATQQAQQSIIEAFGPSQPGQFWATIPDQVTINPKADVPSSTYQVTVAMITIRALYSPTDLKARIERAAQDQLADDEHILSMSEPDIIFESQPTTDEVAVTVSATCTSAVRPDSPLLQAATVAGKSKADALRSLLGSDLVQSATVSVQPFWQSNLPLDPSRIRMDVRRPAADPQSPSNTNAS